MNSYSIGKCFNFGISIKNQFPKLSWDGIILMEDFEDFIKRNNVTDDQLKYTKKGFEGLSFLEEEKSFGKVPFGVHKGKPMESMPNGYILWLANQEWIDKHPSLKAYVKMRIFDMNKNSLPKEDAIKMLEEMKQKL